MTLSVDVEEIEKCLRFFKQINDVPLEEIVWKKNGEVLSVDTAALDEFKFMGLSNRDFPSIMGWLPEGIGIRVHRLTLRRTDEKAD